MVKCASKHVLAQESTLIKEGKIHLLSGVDYPPHHIPTIVYLAEVARYHIAVR